MANENKHSQTCGCDCTHVPRKDGWDKLQILGVSLMAPILLALVGSCFNDSIKQRDIEVRFVEMAIGVLKQDPAKHPNTKEIREWAFDVLVQHSPVDFSESARQELKNEPLLSSREEVVDLSVDSFKIACSGESLVCDRQFKLEFETTSLFKVQIHVSDDMCSSIKVHISLDAKAVYTTGYLGWKTPSEGFDSLPLSTGFIDLGPLNRGRHTLELMAEGQPGGCTPNGFLDQWSSRVQVKTSK